MGFWDRILGRSTRREDGANAPKQLPAHDPWTTPASQEQIRQRIDMLRESRMDAYRNELTSIGYWLKDKTYGGRQGGPLFEVDFITNIAAENRWRGSDLGGRIVETIPEEMTREGWEITIQPSDEDDEDDERADAFPVPGMWPPEPPKNPGVLPEAADETQGLIEALAGEQDELGAVAAIYRALSYERAYGGGAVMIGADDGQEDLSQPLDEERISEIRYLNTFSGGWQGEMVAWSYYSDPRSPKYGMPEIYMVMNDGVPITRLAAPGAPLPAAVVPTTEPTAYAPLIWWVHESRFLLFPGTAVSNRARVQMRGWGDSIFTRVDRVLSTYDQTWGGIANLMTDFSQGVLSVPNLLEMLSANNKPATLKLTDRARAIMLSRSIANMMLIDSDEEFKRDTAPLAGIPDILAQFGLRLAAAAEMPLSLLMGQVKGGLGDAGNTDLRFFYDKVASRQKQRLMPQIKRLVHLQMLAKQGPASGSEPARWNVRFNPLYRMTEKEQAELRKIVADSDHIYIADSVVTPEEVAASRFGGSEWTMETTIDFDGRAKMAAEDQKQRAEREKKAAEMATQMQVAAAEENPLGSDDEQEIEQGEE